MKSAAAAVAALLALASCVAETGEEPTGAAEEEIAPMPTVPPGKTAPAELGRERVWWVPRWDLYELPHTRGRDAPVLAIPRDGRGKPVVLWAGWYRMYGDMYFRVMLHSGYVSMLDLKVIGEQLDEPLPKRHDTPADAVDPFEDHVEIPPATSGERTGSAAQREEGERGEPVCGGGLLTCGEEWPGEHMGGPPPPPTPPQGGGGHGGAPTAGGHGGGPQPPSYVTETGPSLLFKTIRGWLSADTLRAFMGGDRIRCRTICAAPFVVALAGDAACKLPAVRAVPETGIPCLFLAAGRASLDWYGGAGLGCDIMCDKLWEGVQ